MAFIHSRNETMYAIKRAKRISNYPVISWVLSHQEKDYSVEKWRKQIGAKQKEFASKPL